MSIAIIILAVIALLACVVALAPNMPQGTLNSVAGILLSIALIVWWASLGR